MLPAPLTRFVGREAELAETAALLAEARLLTLTGPGGAGKTRLALRLASAVARDFPDGVWFVDLSPLSGDEFVWDEVAMTLDVKEPGPGRTQEEAVGRRLARRQALVVLDNCEHVVQSAAEVTAGLLAAAPKLKIITTSREPLAIGGEVTWAVPPLNDADAVELFSDRARQALPQFQLGTKDTEAVRSICRRLDGLPLAIELAAARTRALAPARIAAELQDHFRVLPSGPRTAPSRQSTLRASFEWSYELLSEAERALLRQLSVFAGGFDVDAALAVCPAARVDLLAALTDRSLIMVDQREEAEPRYRMLETVREFVGERLAEAGESDLVCTRHRDHYLGLAETAETDLAGPQQATWLAKLAMEQDNVRAALAWSRDRDEPEALARTVAALWGFWRMRSRLVEGQMWVEAAAAGAEDLSPALRARIRNMQGFVALYVRHSLAEVPTLVNEALALARAGGDRREEAIALMTLGLAAGLLGGAEAMRPYVEEALPLARSAGFASDIVRSLLFYIRLRAFQSEPDETRRLVEEAIAVAKAAEDGHSLVWATATAGLIELIQGRLADAGQLIESAVADGRRANDTAVISGLLGLALVRMFQGDFAAARAAIAESVAAAQESVDSPFVAIIEPIARWLGGWIELVGGDASDAKNTLSGAANFFLQGPTPGWGKSLSLVVLAQAQLALGGLDEAATSLDEASSVARPGQLTWVLGRVGLIRAKLSANQGDPQEAESLAHEALRLGREAGDQLGLVDALELLARLAAQQDSNKEAVRLWAAAESLRTALGYARFPVEQGSYEAAVAAAKEAIGAEEFAAAWTEGAKLSTEQAIAYAARGRGERKRPATGWASLTPSELEVVRLVGEHLSNPEIAARIFVSRATVKTHLVHIFSKLGIDSRSELAAEAVRRGIQPQASRRS